MAFNFTEKQKLVIDKKAGSLLVSASAGSGKTTVMIERAVSLILQGVSLDKMVICTFTKAAAADMKEKMYKRLSVEYEKTKDPFIETQILYLPAADISTLDSFCQRLIKEYFYISDIDPSFEIMDEGEQSVTLNEIIDEITDELLEKGDEDFMILYDSMLYGRRDTEFKNTVRRIYNFAVTQADPEEWLKNNALCGYSGDSGTEILNNELDIIFSRLKSAADKLLFDTANAGYTRNLPHVQNLIDYLNGLADVLTIPKGAVGDFAELNDRYKDLKDRIKKAVVKREEYSNLLSPDDTVTFAKIFADLTLEVIQRFSIKKRRKNKADYSDLEHFTKRLLMSDEVLVDISQRYKYIFVDEYQDINPLQDDIITKLSRNAELIIVGDIKQSIYAFRMCDPEIFANKYYAPDKYNLIAPVELNNNFRSRRRILDFVNDVFCRSMTTDFGKVDYKQNAQLYGPDENASGEIKINLLLKQKKDRAASGVYSIKNHENGGESVEIAAADKIVYDIIQKLEKGVITENGKTRPVRAGDIAVLTRSNNSTAAFVYERLKKAGVNVFIKKQLLFSSVTETAVLIEYLKLIDNRMDDIALSAVLTSPFCGLSLSDLSEISLYKKEERLPFYEKARLFADAGEPLSDKVKDFFTQLDSFINLSYTLKAGELLGRIVAGNNYFAHVLSGKNGAFKAETLAIFLDSVNSSPFSASVSTYVRAYNASPQSYVPEASPDALKIMPVHSSKGLEFNYVYLINTSQKFNMTDIKERAVLDSELGICLKSWDFDNAEFPPNRLWTAAKVKQKRKQQEEELRLLYVALTRPKEGLYIYANVNENSVVFTGVNEKFPDEADCFFDWLIPSLGTYGYELISGDERIQIEEREEERIFGKGEEYLIERIRERILFEMPKAGGVYKTSVTKIATDSESEPDIPVMDFVDERNTLRGTSFHKAMELFDFDNEFLDEWKKVEHLPEISVGDRSILEKAFCFFKNYLSSRTYFKEKQFMYKGEGQFVQGIVDLLIVDGKKAEIIDYKTTKADIILSESNQRQIALYANAVSEILGLDVVKRSFYSFTSGVLVESK